MHIKTKGKTIIVLLIAFLAGGVTFTIASNSLPPGLLIGFMGKPMVIISKSAASPQGSWGSLYQSTLAVFDVTIKNTSSPVTLSKIPLRIVLSPNATQKANGINSLMLTYNYCRPSQTKTYGYAGYGYVPQCGSFTAPPISAESFAGKTIATFAPQWPFYSDAKASLTLSGKVIYTGNLSNQRKQWVIAQINDRDNVKFVLNSQPVKVQFDNLAGNWLQVFAGYGYAPTR